MLQALEATTRPTDAPPAGTLTIVQQLLTQLENHGVRYCHWKSNESLEPALAGVGDLDLLVDVRDTTAFQAVLFQLGLKETTQSPWLRQPSIRHYYGLDPDTGRLLHIHVYFRLVTGGVVLKNYRLPFESQMIEQSELYFGMPTPPRCIELLIFVLRKMLEAGDPIELVLQRMDREHVRRELRWLLADGDFTVAEACRWCQQWLPQIDSRLFRQAVQTLEGRPSLWRQFLLGRRFRRLLQPLALRSSWVASLISSYRFARRVLGRLSRRGGKQLSLGGRVIALVGPEASGKSTTALELTHWLRSAFRTRTVHVGKPRSSWLSALPNMLRALVRRSRRTNKANQDRCQSRHRTSWSYACASVLLARDRARVCRAAFRNAGAGEIIVCDRYPTATLGRIDGPRLDPLAKSGLAAAAWRWLANMESYYYRNLPRPDVTLELVVPVDLAVQRNRERVKAEKESDQYLARRHSQFVASRSASRRATVCVDTSGPMEEVMRTIKGHVWQQL